jgi:uncharacterized protein
VAHAVRTCHLSGIDYFIIDSEHQRGRDFTERFGHAFQTIFDKGYDRVISIGSDCPAITPALLRKAAQELTANGIVLGPSTDGGVYLIGLSKERFEQIDFGSIDWKTDQVFAELSEHISEQGKAVCLPILSDIDSSQDLASALSRYANHAIIKILKNILREFETISFQYRLSHISFPPFSFGLKAPPSISF